MHRVSWEVIVRSPCRLMALLLVLCVAGIVSGAPDDSSLSAVAGGSGWIQTETSHFTIIFRPQDEPAAREIVGFADQVYEDVSAYLDVTAGPRIPVVIRGRTGDANGYFTVLPVRIVIYTATASTPIVAPDLDQWLRLVFTHDLVTQFVTGLFIGNINGSTKYHLTVGIDRGDVDNGRVTEFTFDIFDTTLDEPLLLTRCVVFRIFFKITVFTRSRDCFDHFRSINRFQLQQFIL